MKNTKTLSLYEMEKIVNETKDKMKELGYIYVLTNPCFKEYVKIGYSKDPVARVNKINQAETVPFSYRIVCTLATERTAADLVLHKLIDQLAPNARCSEIVNGKERKKEFYEMSPEDACSILCSIAQISGYEDRLKIYEPNEYQKQESRDADATTRRHRRANFNFTECHIPMGAKINFLNDSSVDLTVASGRQVQYNGKLYYLSNVAKELVPEYSGTPGISMFTYKGKSLYDYYNEYQSES